MPTSTIDAPRVTIGLRFAVPGHYGYGPTFTDFDRAVAEAAVGIKTFDYGGHKADSRAFVDLRESFDVGNLASAGDAPIMRWEVFKDGSAVRVPDGQGGLSDEQRDALVAAGAITANERAGRAREAAIEQDDRERDDEARDALRAGDC